MKFKLLLCFFVFYNCFAVFGQNVNLYFETENGTYYIANIDTINSSVFRNKTVVLKVKNNKKGEYYKISSNGSMFLEKIDSVIENKSNTYQWAIEYNPIFTEATKKLIVERSSQRLLLSIILIKYREGKVVENIPIKVCLIIKH
jgi:hypothetical protein